MLVAHFPAVSRIAFSPKSPPAPRAFSSHSWAAGVPSHWAGLSSGVTSPVPNSLRRMTATTIRATAPTMIAAVLITQAEGRCSPTARSPW